MSPFRNKDWREGAFNESFNPNIYKPLFNRKEDTRDRSPFTKSGHKTMPVQPSTTPIETGPARPLLPVQTRVHKASTTSAAGSISMSIRPVD